MARYTGKDLVLTFGATTLDTEYRTFETEDKIGMKDSSAGGDTDRTFETTLKEGQATYSALHQTGTTVYDAVAPGTAADLVWSPEGTDVGKPKFTVPALVENRKMKAVYDDMVKLDLTFKFNGPVVESTW